MQRALFLTLAVWLLAIPSSGFCGDPVAMNVLGAINYSINSINNARIIDQNQQAINNQREYLQQQAEALRQQNEIARQQLELQRRALAAQQPQAQQRDPLEVLALMAEDIYKTCDQKGLDDVEKGFSGVVTKVSDEKGVTIFSWSGDWNDNMPIINKKVLVKLLVSANKCWTNDKATRVNIFKDGDLVAYADKKQDIIKIVK